MTQDKSTSPETVEQNTVRTLQQRLLQLAGELETLDQRLAELVEGEQPRADHELWVELINGTHAVRTDLLADAIETLMALGHRNRDGVLRRRRELARALERLAAC